MQRCTERMTWFPREPFFVIEGLQYGDKQKSVSFPVQDLEIWCYHWFKTINTIILKLLKVLWNISKAILRYHSLIRFSRNSWRMAVSKPSLGCNTKGLQSLPFQILMCLYFMEAPWILIDHRTSAVNECKGTKGNTILFSSCSCPKIHLSFISICI